MKFLGIDYHKKRSFATLINQNGLIVGRFTIRHNNIDEDLKKIKTITQGDKTKTVLESTMNWGFMYDKLWEYFGHSMLANPYKMKIIAESTNKNDKVDSYVLAQFLRMNYIPQSYAPSPQVRLIKDLIRHRISLVQERVRAINRIHLVLLKEGIFDNKVLDEDRSWSVMSAAGRKIIERLVQGWTTHHQTIYKNNMDLIDIYTEKIEDIEQIFYKNWQSTDPIIKRLMTIPGIGLITAISIRYEVDDISRFPNSRRFVRYCGLCPTTSSSDERIYHGKIVKSVNKYLQSAFVESTLGAIRGSAQAKAYYYKHKQRTNKSNIARIILAKRICEIVYQVWKYNCCYEPRFFNCVS